jgi:Zn-dependent protease with chaperone function
MLAFFSDLFTDRLLMCVLIVVAAACTISAFSLLVARLFKSRSPLRYTVLLTGLLCCLAAPGFTVALRGFHTSTIAFQLRTDADEQKWASSSADSDAAVTQWFGSWFGGARQRDAESVAAPAPLPRAIVGTLKTGQEQLKNTEHSIRSTNASVSAGGIMEIGRRWLAGGIVVWLAGCVFLLTRLVWTTLHLNRIRQDSKPLTGPGFMVIQSEISRRLAVRRVPPVLESARVQSPVATGLLRGTVLVPAGLSERIDSQQLCDVLTHEVAHIIRRDPLVVYLQAVAGSLFWPTPLVHLLNRQLNATREEICDNYVLGAQDPLQYAETLV